MFVDVDEADIERRPGRRAPTDAVNWWEIVGAGFRSEVIETDWHNYLGRREQEAFGAVEAAVQGALSDEEVAAALAERGVTIPNNARAAGRVRNGAAYQQAIIGLARGALDPREYGEMPESLAALRQSVRDEVREEWDDAQGVLQVGDRWAPEFLGRSGAAVSDEMSLLMMPLGVQGGIARTAITEAALGALGEAAIIPRMFEVSDELGLPEPDPLSQIAFGAAAGGVLGAGGAFAATALGRAMEYRRISHATPNMVGAETQAAVEAAEGAMTAGRDPVAAAETAAQSVREVTAPPEPTPQQAPEATEGPMPESAPLSVLEQDAGLEGEGPTLPTREQLQSEADDLRAQFPEINRAQPTLDYIRSLGGIQARRMNPATQEMEPTQLASELRAADVTRNSVVRLFNNARGRADLDNIPAAEFSDGGTPRLPEDGNGYVDRQALIDAIIQEAGGRPAYRTIEAEQAATRLRELDDEISAIRDDIDARIEAEMTPEMGFDAGFVPARVDGEDGLARADQVERLVDEYGGSASQAVRWRAMEYLDETGGSVEDAIVRAHMDEIEEDFYAYGNQGSEAPSDTRAEALPQGAEDAGAGRDQRAAAEDAGIDEGIARSDGPASERTEAGEQTLIDGVAPITDRDRMQQAQNAPMRGGAAAVDIGMFDSGARAQQDMFSDITSADYQGRLDAEEAEIRAAIEAGELDMADVGVLEGQPISARYLLDEIDADQRHLDAVTTCRLGGPV